MVNSALWSAVFSQCCEKELNVKILWTWTTSWLVIQTRVTRIDVYVHRLLLRLKPCSDVFSLWTILPTVIVLSQTNKNTIASMPFIEYILKSLSTKVKKRCQIQYERNLNTKKKRRIRKLDSVVVARYSCLEAQCIAHTTQKYSPILSSCLSLLTLDLLESSGLLAMSWCGKDTTITGAQPILVCASTSCSKQVANVSEKLCNKYNLFLMGHRSSTTDADNS